MSAIPNYYMVFDVESIGLHGEGFAVGFVVVDAFGKEYEAAMFSCPSIAASGSESGHSWVAANCPNFEVNNESPWQVRSAFWAAWKEWKEKGAALIADCAWPVEARFLSQCINDNLTQREWEGPYPLHDVASFLLSKGKDPLEKRERIPNEMPEHNPLADARQSARILIECLLPIKEEC